MKDLEKILDQLSQETLRSLNQMSKLKDAAKRREEAEIVSLLCKSMGSMVDSAAAAMSEMMDHPFIDDDDYED